MRVYTTRTWPRGLKANKVLVARPISTATHAHMRRAATWAASPPQAQWHQKRDARTKELSGASDACAAGVLGQVLGISSARRPCLYQDLLRLHQQGFSTARGLEDTITGYTRDGIIGRQTMVARFRLTAHYRCFLLR